jgi:uncharacterized protein YfiM (DUF2279 family)
MVRAFRRDSRIFFGLLISLVAASVAAVGQTTSVQTTSGQTSAQTSAAQTSSNQPAATSAAEQSAYGLSSSQSLADVARANQEKKAAEGSTAPSRTITNADLPKNPEGYTGPPPDDKQHPMQNSGNTAKEAAQQRAAERAGAQWRQQIVTQRNKIAMLETRIDRLRAQIGVVDPNAADDYSSGTSYNGAQATQIRILKEMEANLSQQRQRLEEMQDAARRAGMHTTVYDP